MKKKSAIGGIAIVALAGLGIWLLTKKTQAAPTDGEPEVSILPIDEVDTIAEQIAQSTKAIATDKQIVNAVADSMKGVISDAEIAFWTRDVTQPGVWEELEAAAQQTWGGAIGAGEARAAAKQVEISQKKEKAKSVGIRTEGYPWAGALRRYEETGILPVYD